MSGKSALLLERLKAQVATGDLGRTAHQHDRLERLAESERQRVEAEKSRLTEWSAEDLELKAWLDAWDCPKDPRHPEQDQYRQKEWLAAVFALGPGSHYHSSGVLAAEVRRLREEHSGE